MPDIEDDAGASEPDAEGADENIESDEGDENTPEPEPQPEEPDGDGEPEPAAPVRRQSREQRLANQLREEREARIRAEARAEERERAQQVRPAADPHEAARIRAEKLALMDPLERKTFEMEETIQQMRRDQQIAQIRNDDNNDRVAYQAKAQRDPVYSRHEKRVDEVLAEMRRNGQNAPRETVLKYVIGEEALKAAQKKPATGQKAAAAARVATSKGAPASARGDVGGTRTDKGESLAAMKARLLEREKRGDMG